MLTHDSRKTRQQNPLTILPHLYPILFILIILLNISCSRQITDPGFDDNATPGRRDYAWTVDTLKVPWTYLYKMWGSASNDIWAVGSYSDARTNIFHFDGNTWSSDGIFRAITPCSVYGFNSSDIWMCGFDGKIWYNNGNGWTQSAVFSVPGSFNVTLQSIWGDNINWLFTAGSIDYNRGYQTVGLLLKYDNGIWVKQTNAIADTNTQFIKVIGTNDHLLILGVTSHDLGDTMVVYEYDGNTMKVLYKNAYVTGKSANLGNIAGTPYMIFGTKVYSYTNKGLHFIMEYTNPALDYTICGRSSKDILFSNTDGITHYNGSDIQYLYKFPGGEIQVMDSAVFENDVFFLADDFNAGLIIIIHGKLEAKG
jgi:hypothetical protein